ncbi:MAG TPA: hypothetical protein PKU97_04535 [Kofleriaceae bacterium]|nr:hypothetical protein [Kofleriaceae bacterium]
MDVFGLEPRQSDLARGIVIVKCANALTRAEQRQVWQHLAAAGITEDDSEETTPDDQEPPLRLLTAPWLPPATEEVGAQRAALERANAAFALDAVWFIKVETGVDGEAWQELRAAHLAERREEAAAQAAGPPRRVVDAIFDEAEVLYTAPDAPLTNLTVWPAADLTPALARAQGPAADSDDAPASGSLSGFSARGAVAPGARPRASGEDLTADDVHEDDGDDGDDGRDDSGRGDPSGDASGATSGETVDEELADDPQAEFGDDSDEDDGDDDDSNEDDEDDDDSDEDDGDGDDRDDGRGFGSREDEEDDDSVMELFLSESHWRNGTPPSERSVPFPLEHYPEVLDQYDWREFGIALKLGGTAIAGEDSVINAFFALWLSAYQDERIESFEPFARADVAHDRVHRSALLWVERFTVPATPADQVSFLMWIIHRLHEIIPVAWARFDIHDESGKVRRDEQGEIELILAGNPLAERLRRYGESEALSWAVAQSGWTRAELAAMLVEAALEHDPDNAESAVHAERLLRRALSFDASSEATTFLAAVLVRQGRAPEAILLAREGRAPLRLFLAREVAEHAESKLGQVLPLLDADTMERSDDEDLADLAHAIAVYAPRHLAAYLERTPARVTLLPHLYNASFELRREQSLAILRRVLSLPEPDATVEGARGAMVMAWNNACIHAHALGEYELAVELADRGMPFAEENPHIYHSAACAYAAMGQIAPALTAVRNAIAHDYEHIEKMETDPDLGPLHGLPEFSAMFAEWRHQRADLN